MKEASEIFKEYSQTKALLMCKYLIKAVNPKFEHFFKDELQTYQGAIVQANRVLVTKYWFC